MSFGRTKDQRRAAAKKHLQDVRVCPRCSRKIRGNAYWSHARACKRRLAGEAGHLLSKEG